MVAKGRTRGKGGTSKNSAAPTSELGEGAAVTDQAENSDVVTMEESEVAEGAAVLEGTEVVTTEESEVAEGAAVLEGTEVDEGEMEGVEGNGGENTSFEESGDMEQSIQPGEDDLHAEDDGEFGGEELIGDGADDGAAVNIDEENEEGISDISWVEELWNRKKSEEADAENAHTAEEEEQVADDVDFEMEDESKERLDSTQKEQAEDPDESQTSNENKTVATADQGETEEGTTVSPANKWRFPKSLQRQMIRNTCIPQAYFGPAFDKSCFQCCIRMYPVSYADMIRPDFASILQSVDCVRLPLRPRSARCLELFCRESMPVVHNLIFSAQSIRSVTIEIDRRKPIGWKEVTQNETTVSVPTAFSLEECTKAKFTLNTGYFRKNLCKPINVNAHQSVKERSLFINNVKNKDRGILKHIFPLASKIALVKVSEDVSSAVLTMKSQAMVLDHLAAVTDVSINGLKLEMGAVNMTQEAARKLIDLPHTRKLSEKRRERNMSSSGAGADDGQKARTGPGGDQEKKDKERKSQELKDKERLDREKKDREQRERAQRQRDRERERGQKSILERETPVKHAEMRVRKREQARKESSREEKNTRREPDRSLRTGRQGTGGRQRSGGLWGHPGGQMRHEMGMRHEMNAGREMQREMERELEREMEIEREMRRQREMRKELERERREREEWEWQDMERREMEARQEEERERRHQEEVLREKEKLEKMHQNAVLKLMMVEEQQRREREELQRREHEMEMEKKHMQQQLEEERRRQRQEKEEWERTSRKRGRYEEPEAVSPRLGGMANKRGRGSEGPWENFFVSGDGSDQPQSQRPSGKYLSPAAGSSSEPAAKYKLELEVARQAEELKKSLALLDKIQKVPMGASATFGEVHGGTEKGHRDQQPDPQQLYAKDFRPQNYNAQYQDYDRDMSHFQYSHGGGQETATGDSYSNQYGGGDHTGHQSTSTWGAGAAEGGSWRPNGDKETGGYSQPARQWRNTQRQGQSKGGQGGQSRGDQGGRQRRGQDGRQKKEGGYQQSVKQGADSNYSARDRGHEGGGYAAYGQQQHQGGGDYKQKRWSSGGGRHGGQGKAGNY